MYNNDKDKKNKSGGKVKHELMVKTSRVKRELMRKVTPVKYELARKVRYINPGVRTSKPLHPTEFNK
jgi:hypothetical protein